MPVRTETVYVREHAIEMTHLPLVAARRTLVRLAQLVGPGLAKTLGGADSLASLRGMEGSALAALGEGISDVLMRVSDADLESLADTLGGACVLVQGDKRRPMRAEVREELFAGSLATFFEWLAAAIRYQYADFSTAWGAVLAAASGPGAAAAPETSTRE